MVNNVQPTILVKKSDGTFVRMSLGEIKKKKEEGALVKVKTEIPTFVGMTSEKSEPVKMTKADAKSLLEEDIPDTIGTAAAVSRVSQVDLVIKKLNFSVAENYFNRLRSAVQLRLKDVRGEKETRATVLRSIKDGGLGLSEAQADELEKICVMVGEARPHPTLPFLKREGRALVNQGQTLPQAFNLPPVPARVSPNNSFIHAAKFQIRAVPISRPAMNDVVAVSAPVSPVEEIRIFSLTDFRRLSNDPIQAAKRLAQKFLNLKEESILIYWQALDAWKQSPMFSDYVGVLNRSLLGDKTTTSGQGIVAKEIEALIQMEKDLAI